VAVAQTRAGARERARHRDTKVLRDRAIIAVLLGSALRRSRGRGAHRWMLFGRIHTGGDGRRAAREYAGGVGVVMGRIAYAISDPLLRAPRRFSAQRTCGVCAPSPILSAIRRLAVAGAGRAPDAGVGRRHRSREDREVESLRLCRQGLLRVRNR